MTVQALIEQLSKYPPEMIVVVTGYEGGFDDIPEVEIIKITKEEGASWWGVYDEDEENGEEVVYLPR